MDKDNFDASLVVTESFGPISARIDTEKGIVHDALIFGPKQRVGKHFQGSSGLYSEDFFKSLAVAVEGAWSWPYHPNVNNKTLMSRDVRDAIGKWKNVRVVMEGGLPKVRGDYKIRPKVKEEYLDLIAEGADRFAFSVFGPTKRMWDHAANQPVAYAVDETSRLKFTVDMVEAGGTNDNIFESATADSVKPKEKDQMTTEETQAMLDKHDKELTAKIMESVSPEIKKVEGLVAENAILKRKQAVHAALAEHKMDTKNVSESFRMVLESCPENQLKDLILDRKGLLAAATDPIKGAGADGTNKGGDKGLTFEHAVEVIGARGIHTIVAEMAGTGFGGDREKDRKFSRQWVDLIGRKISNQRDKSEKTRELRRTIVEQFGTCGLRNLFAGFYGVHPMTESDMSILPNFTDDRAVNVAEAAVDSTGFSTLNNTVLAAAMIEAQNEATGLVADQLMTAYPTNKETENVPGFDEPSDMEDVAEAAEKPDMTISNKYVTLQKIVKRAKKVLLTREAVFYDRTAQLLDRANRISVNAVLDRETRLIKGIIDDSTARSYYPSGAVNSLWSATNTEEGNALADYTDLENAIRRLSRQQDSLSRRLRDNVSTPLEILLPFELWITAQKIFGAEMFESNPGGTYNIKFSNSYGSTRLFPSQVLDAVNTTTWYIAGAGGFKKQYLKKVTFPLEFVPVPAAEVDTVIKDLVGGVAVMYAEQVFARENVRVIRNFATALS